MLWEAIKNEALNLLSEEKDLSHEEAEKLASEVADKFTSSSAHTESLNEDILNILEDLR